MTSDNKIGIKFFCRHLLCLGVSYTDNRDQPSNYKTHFFSGSVLEIQSEWLFMTAGHVTEAIRFLIKSDKISNLRFVWVDSFGFEASNFDSIPTVISEETVFGFDDGNGIDIGFVSIRSQDKNLMSYNRIVPITRDVFINQELSDFDRFVLVGVPSELVEQSLSESNNAHAKAVLLSFSISDENPKEFEEKRFSGIVGDLPTQFDLKSMDGLSGSPVFAIKFGPQIKYWFLGIQSSWLRQERKFFVVDSRWIAAMTKMETAAS